VAPISDASSRFTTERDAREFSAHSAIRNLMALDFLTRRRADPENKCLFASLIKLGAQRETLRSAVLLVPIRNDLDLDLLGPSRFDLPSPLVQGKIASISIGNDNSNFRLALGTWASRFNSFCSAFQNCRGCSESFSLVRRCSLVPRHQVLPLPLALESPGLFVGG